MKIFAVETSAKSASVAITEDGTIKGEFYINTMLTHSETLMPMTDALFKNVRLSPNDMDCFAVNEGPGSFTGLRIGVAAVKGMAYALGKPCAGVSTLESMAYNVSSLTTSGIVCAVMDARCSQVYNALFSPKSGSLVPFERLCDDRALSVEELTRELAATEKGITLVGDGAKLCYEHMRDKLNVTLAPEHVLYQRASGTAFAAENIVRAGKTISAAQLMPTYLRLPQAERERLAHARSHDA